MKDLQNILRAYQHLEGPAVLATVVKVTGSAYRKPGARMLILPDGSTVGSISGGCLEHDVAEKAKGLMKGGDPQLAVFDMTSDDDLWGYGQGCHGVIFLLLERLDPVHIWRPFQFIQQRHEDRSNGVIATVMRVDGELRLPLGARLFLSSEGVEETLRHPVASAAILEQSQEALVKEGSFAKELRFMEGTAEIFFEFVRPPLFLTICGAASNSIPVSRLAAELGWKIRLIDHRPALATRERFPEASDIVVCRPEELDESMPFDARSAALIMTHQFQHDLQLLRFFLSRPFPSYVGLLGARKRRDLLFQQLKEGGIDMDSARRSRVFAPVGLDIGTENPEEIALAVIAEIQTAFSRRSGGFLKDR